MEGNVGGAAAEPADQPRVGDVVSGRCLTANSSGPEPRRRVGRGGAGRAAVRRAAAGVGVAVVAER